ncbi:MAG: FAD-dependent oxidoreductase [Vicinamibacterales bacterium]
MFGLHETLPFATMSSMNDLHYFRPDWVRPSDERLRVDVCIYGGTSAGLIAAVEARRRGKRVVVLHPGKILGGLTTGGLGWTDYGRKNVIGGLSREFYRRLGKHYRKPEEFQFEPHAAGAVFGEMLRENDVPVRMGQYLDRVQTQDGRIEEVLMLGGLRASARVFIDATYEGDLMAQAGVSCTVGREDNDIYNETLNGIQVREFHQFSHPVDPFVRAGDPSSGLLPGILDEDLSAVQGRGDQRVQAYCFRMCMTDDPALKIDWPKPDGYDPLQYVLADRWFSGEKDDFNDQLRGEGVHASVPVKFDIFPNKTPGGFHKTDTNNHGPFSSDFIGANHAWPQASYEARERIFQAHVTYQQGFYWHMANADGIPQRYRDAYRRWGLPKDEFTSTGNWPYQLYVREGRRMIGDYVITEHDCRGTRVAEDSVGMGSYGMDSHNCARFVKRDADGRARVLNEGDVQVEAVPYPIPYRAIVPKRGQCPNLIVPVCLSSSHIAYGSARMEPVFMALGQSAAIAACRAIDDNRAVQEIRYAEIRKALDTAGQVLTAR